ncbi:S-formylglutathione hydrolase [Bacterioplanoides pacificum]|uniref:S-formylglutathione hydrolase n=1 Tax=Bacterioplanoides pacificum TaxID=1171596 RepID=A0ABV7VRQ9_9GAMM
MSLELIAQNKSFAGWHKQYRHVSRTLGCDMRFAIFLPPQANDGPVPVVYWLSGLTCSDENFMQKAGAHQLAAELGLAIVAPDTSPRGSDGLDNAGNPIADDDSYDLGQGAGFYVDATQPPWNDHYHMYSYVVSELPQLIASHFPVSDKKALMGHSMGGHGAITIGLKNAQHYTSVSAFSPISNPMNCPWGEKAFSHYLGNNRDDWKAYDSCELMSAIEDASGYPPLWVDQGLADNFLTEQLKPEALQRAAEKVNYPLTLQQHDGYDHSYYFIASFIAQQLRFHAQYLR